MASEQAVMPIQGTQTRRPFYFRIPITLCIIAVLCGFFWIGSRYPSLQGKASAYLNEALSTPLGFERFFPEPPADQRLRHIGWTAVEWGITNRQGMTYGLLLAAAMLTILPLVRRPRGGKFAGALQGMLIGTPLGVCVNCAAPIAQGMLKGGGRVETALATLVSSPTFNVIVLGIVFTLFPWYLAVLKILAGVFLVLVVVPWLARLAERPGWSRPQPVEAHLPGLQIFQRIESLLGTTDLGDGIRREAAARSARALGWVVVHYVRNLGRVLVTALPLMLLAGLLGAVLVEVLPWSLLNHVSRVDGGRGERRGAAPGFRLRRLHAGADGLRRHRLLGAPQRGDAGARGGGAPGHARLLQRLRLEPARDDAVLAHRRPGGGGDLRHRRGDRRHRRRRRALERPLPGAADRRARRPSPRSTGRAGVAGGPERQRAEGAGPTLRGRPTRSSPRDRWISGTRRSRPSGVVGEKPFHRMDGSTVGFKRLPLPPLYETMQPGPMHLGSLAAGDTNDDGWPDVAVGTSYGVFLYANLGGRYELHFIDFPAMRSWRICEWPWWTSMATGSSTSTSPPGCTAATSCSTAVASSRPRRTPSCREVGQVCNASAAFADVDRDGLVDIVTGGATFESWYFYPEPAVNRLWHNRGGGKFEPEPLAGPEGDTLSLLFTDLNGDGWPDLLVGNDFDEPNRVYLNEHGKLRAVKAAESPLPFSAMTTMSFDTGDLDNDGRPELYVGQIAMRK